MLKRPPHTKFHLFLWISNTPMCQYNIIPPTKWCCFSFSFPYYVCVLLIFTACCLQYPQERLTINTSIRATKKKLILTNVIYANGYGDWWLCVIFIYRTNGRRRRFMYAFYIVFIHKCPSFKLKMQQNWRTMNWKRCIFLKSNANAIWDLCAERESKQNPFISLRGVKEVFFYPF